LFLARQFDNPCLEKICLKVNANISHFFFFSSKRFHTMNRQTLSQLFNFTIYINDEAFRCNSAFASCLSNTVFNLRLQNPSIQEIHFNNIDFHDILLSLFQILNGYSFDYFSFDMNEIQSAIDLIGLISFSGELSSPTTFEEAITFLSNLIFIQFEEQFEKSCNLIARNFSQITSSDFTNLTNKSLERILSLDALRLPSENFLFERILENTNKLYLLKFVIFPAIDYQLLKQFIQELDFMNVHIDLFENLKKIFELHPENIPIQRWLIFPNILSFDQLDSMSKLLNLYSQENKSSIEKLQEILFNYKEYEIQNDQLKTGLQSEINNSTRVNQKVKELENELKKLEAKNQKLEEKLHQSRSLNNLIIQKFQPEQSQSEFTKRLIISLEVIETFETNAQSPYQLRLTDTQKKNN
jgi:hypothetical protein